MHAQIDELAAALADAARAVRPEQLESRTPCDQFTVAELLGHLSGVLAGSERAARNLPQTAEAPEATPNAVADQAAKTAAAWADPAAYQGMTEFGPGEMPAQAAAAITLQELALHGWDLARATGRDFAVSEEAAQAVLGVVGQIAEQARGTGAYGPALEAPADAGAFAQALAASGRAAHWTR
ncbi:TIGR03086 family metal-binding protein [Streptomyces sp. A3M-1-3]|uniref:TIGR03086 family metal-binding protein n=1 Tax=Streptomyces sp. A3M-1-3 TaxID=2962044 RepID=UPI0020B7A654|nr:TIGR03086 family metal-binding protein [Streptomyces sp. A3M-1-3]MCP3816871.1 TIGR03086 family metal-binding protein [Streptomyces sp. A3M-1-3]